jgi:DNA ligase (NAD+)
VWVIKEKRSWSEITVKPPSKCPICNSRIINKEIHYYCSNDYCPAQIKAKLEHFVSKNCMDIMWIGDSMIDILVDQKIISNIADLFQLTDQSYQILLQKFPWFGIKKVSEISNQLIQTKEKPLRRLINWLW